MSQDAPLLRRSLLGLERYLHCAVLASVNLDALPANDSGSVLGIHLDLIAAGWSTAEKFAVWPRCATHVERPSARSNNGVQSKVNPAAGDPSGSRKRPVI